jgi:hypothetical protein
MGVDLVLYLLQFHLGAVSEASCGWISAGHAFR